MFHRGAFFLCLCIMAVQMFQFYLAMELPVDPEVRARLEEKVMSSMSLKDLEAMVENDERVINVPKSKLLIIPKAKSSSGLLADPEGEAIIIHRKPKNSYKESESRFAMNDFDAGIRRSYEPDFLFESEFRHEERFPSLFKISDLESAASTPVRQFYESIVQSILGKERFGLESEPLSTLDVAASEDVPEYKPRFDYDAYSKDSTETKLQGKPYWKDAPDRREETVDENGCRTVIKKVVDPDDAKKSNGEKAKTVVITKECEYPNLNGPDAKITEVTPLRYETSRYDSQSPSDRASYDDEPSTYDKSRPTELEAKDAEARDPLAPDYIDTMLEKHFKNFPGFKNPITSFRGYQERFKLRTPEGFKDIKPTVGIHTYEYTHPKSGFEEERQAPAAKEYVREKPTAEVRTYEHTHPKSGFEEERHAPAAKEYVRENPPKIYEHHYNYDYPEENPRNPPSRDYSDDKEAESSNPKEPKMMKKSFAYYRKENPKSDPNDQQYAEEYAQGNYRSFSSSYDSEKDGPKKKE